MRAPIEPPDSGTCLSMSAAGCFDAVGRPLVNVADPVDPQDVATRAYVDRGGTVYEIWVCSTNLVMANPSNGSVRFNAATMEATTQIALSAISANNVDASIALDGMIPGDQIYLQDSNDVSRYARDQMPIAPVKQTSGGPWWLIDVTLLRAGISLIEGNSKTLIALMRVGNTITKQAFEALAARVG